MKEITREEIWERAEKLISILSLPEPPMSPEQIKVLNKSFIHRRYIDKILVLGNVKCSLSTNIKGENTLLLNSMPLNHYHSVTDKFVNEFNSLYNKIYCRNLEREQKEELEYLYNNFPI